MTVEYEPLEPQLVDLMIKRNAKDIQYGILHHSATAQGNVDSFRMFHLARGFSDIGYHFVICNGKGGGDGEIEAGRPVLLAGAHAIPRNADSIGICLVGDFTKTVPTTSQLNSTVDLLIRLMEQFPMAYDRLLGHKDVDRTLCPGVLSTRELAQLVQREREKEPKPKSQYQYEKEALAKLAAKAGFNQPHAVDEEWRAGMIALVLDRLGLLD